MPSDNVHMPERYHRSVVPHLMLENAVDAIDFYCRAFEAVELFRLRDKRGQILHAELTIAGACVMVGDATPPFTSPSSATTVALHLFVEDVHRFHLRAVEHGCAVVQSPTHMFYGARQAIVRDPFGHLWVVLEQEEDLPISEVIARGRVLDES